MKPFAKLLLIALVAYSVYEVQAVKPYHTQQAIGIQKYEVLISKTNRYDEKKMFTKTFRAKSFEDARNQAGEKYGYNRIRKITLKE